jgi:hypothetical protein
MCTLYCCFCSNNDKKGSNNKRDVKNVDKKPLEDGSHTNINSDLFTTETIEKVQFIGSYV